MFLEKIFGNLFGLIWLLIFIIAILSLMVWLFVKKDKKVNFVNEEKKQLVEEEYKGFYIKENDESKFKVLKQDGEILKIFDSLEDARVFVDILLHREENDNEYEIIELDGFFKVRKIGSEKTIRKFSTLEEAQNYVKEKQL